MARGDPTHPFQAGVYIETPEAVVVTEDPSLTRGPFKQAFWSYPIIRNGLIYVVDVRNGIYVLRYTGPHADQVTGTSFLEGNSNVGDALLGLVALVAIGLAARSPRAV